MDHGQDGDAGGPGFPGPGFPGPGFPGPGFPGSGLSGQRSGLESTGVMVETMAATLVLARALVISGHAVDLEGVDREIGDLCAETIALPRDEGVQLRPALLHLLREVEALEADLAGLSRAGPTG